jgi:hypothetical protein
MKGKEEERNGRIGSRQKHGDVRYEAKNNRRVGDEGYVESEEQICQT